MYQEVNEIATKNAASLANHLERTNLTLTEKIEAVDDFRSSLIGCNAVTIEATEEILYNYINYITNN